MLEKSIFYVIGEVRDVCIIFVDNSKELWFWNGIGIKYNFC